MSDACQIPLFVLLSLIAGPLAAAEPRAPIAAPGLAFSEPAEAAPAPRKFPAHWGEPPGAQTRDYRPLPGGYGNGSSTLARWIQDHLDKDASASAEGFEWASAPAAGEPGKFAMEEIRREAEARGVTSSAGARAIRVTLAVDQEGQAAAQSYRIRVRTEGGRRSITVRGADPIGAMYGGLDIAEAIRTGTLDALTDCDRQPHIARRGIKFNLPLDLRTPSYTDCSDAAQANLPVMWEREFWTAFLDAMARHRYNVLSLWSLHPFPSLVRVPEFPEVALADVWRTRAKLDDTFSFAGSDMVRPGMLADHEVVKRLTIDEKIAFWRWIMQHAADRGIQVYFFTWNVFTFGAEGKHGITNDLNNEITKEYFRASVREMVKTYPLLAGMGITAGEGMPHDMDSKVKEAWLWDTYGEGVRDALKNDPQREFRMIHRFHWTAQGDILDAFKQYPGPFDFSFKYSVAHMYSIPNPPFIQPLLEHLAPGRKTWLTVRNDDLYTFRFGDPAYAREYIVNMPPADKIAGFYMGPDGYVWGRDFLERHPDPGPRPLVMEKQWYAFMLWGRLAYDPSLPDSHFERVLAARHPQASSSHLFRALQGASQVMPLITRFFWGDIDLKWYPEACLSHPRSKGFYTVRHFMDGISMPGAEVLCIRDWRARLTARQPMTETTPLQIADALDGAAAKTLASLETLRDASKADSELRKTVNDCEALAWLGRYYASKIRGACALALFDVNTDTFEQQAALRHLGEALAHWKRYAAIRDAQYVPALYNRVGHVDVTALTAKVAADIDIARDWKPGTLQDDGKRSGTEKGFRK
ncbi:MAG: carbohydrate-binding family 6 protein [Verrucomicrobiia bacterium]